MNKVIPVEINKVIQKASQALVTAKQGMLDFTSPKPDRRRTGFWNFVVFSRAVTNALQKLRSLSPDFDPWYSKYQTEMANDQIMKYFYNLRSEILKEGEERLSTTVEIISFSTEDIQKWPPAPPGTTGFFIGDRNGGSGYHVEMSDGEVVPYYVDLPGNNIKVTLHLLNHNDEQLTEKQTKDYVQHYYTYMLALMNDARNKFETKTE